MTAATHAWRALVALTGLTLVAGCLTDGPVRGPGTREGRSNEAAASEAPTDAEAILERYGLTLPRSASTPEVEIPAESEGAEESYRLAFTSDADEAEELCHGINGPLIALRLTESEGTEFGVPEAPEGALICYGSRPDYGRQQWRVLYAGDPAEVILALFLMPVR